ncbi:hypothetical protein [Chitinimonas sp.]|uniref:hypothetical protein n=1 Tax=Chitinimonas sp. TaxID=1934313 RepID=UPI0035B4DE09
MSTTSTSLISFRRRELAEQFCNALTGDGLLDARSGLFLAAQRRVGKSTFLREDLIPLALERGWVCVYVDLWADRSRDPALLIGEAVRDVIAGHAGLVSKLAKAIGLSKVTVAGALTMDVGSNGLPAGLTLTQALTELARLAEKPVLLVIDEAQHALTTPAGSEAMFALKAARDALNSSNQAPSLMLVFTGSNRDKLAHLVRTSKMPFYGCNVTPFPLLGRDFSDIFCATVNQRLSPTNQFQPDAVWAAFDLLGRRPELLRSVIADVAMAGEATDLSTLLKSNASVIQARIWHDIQSEYQSLTPIQQAVVRVMASASEGFSPFGDASMKRYAELCHEAVSPPSVQNALENLRSREIIWRESRGSYELEDQSWKMWLLSQNLLLAPA